MVTDPGTTDRRASRAGRIARAWRARALVAVAALTVVLGGCGGSSITATRLQDSVAPTFANLYVRQQAERGKPGGAAADLQAQATCSRADTASTDHGAGSDWVCAVQWLVAGPGTPVGATYDVSVKPNGCYTADGPASVVGQQTLISAAGSAVVNPLWQFSSCFDTT